MYNSFTLSNSHVLVRRAQPWNALKFMAKFHRPSGALLQKSAVKYPPPDLPEMPPCYFKPEPYQNMSKDQMLEIRKRNCNPMTMKVTYYKRPVFINQGYMQWLWDVDGRRYLDMFAGVATVSVGHCHPKVTEAAERQLRRLWHTTSIYVYPQIQEYAEKLASLMPDPLKVVYLTNSGSEANDLAMMMARLHTGNFDIITLRGSYHGGSPQTLGLTANSAYKYPTPSGLGCHNTMCPDVFRGPWGGSHCRDSPVQTIRNCSCSPGHCEANDKYIGQLKEVFATSVPSRIAAFFGEPIQGVGGAVQYPKNYLKETYKLVRERGGICIADESRQDLDVQEVISGASKVMMSFQIWLPWRKESQMDSLWVLSSPPQRLPVPLQKEFTSTHLVVTLLLVLLPHQCWIPLKKTGHRRRVQR
ncbi:alanine--glyoxylate aminotransferase 2, mitochondrial isoform X2 [Chanos chanos]|uniref:Alanine--glyoxylate aminotransferase 2, mitochondrial n=1 Tax=Chanos chanos TaxID=29144 RepID=A0A6J2V105_CHACN|nr:alanine--glyoxylate aminotransferase 2, mitochondrial isoform X2 [Chanos chanos]